MSAAVLLPEGLLVACLLASLVAYGRRRGQRPAALAGVALLALLALAAELWFGAYVGRLAPGGFVQDRFALFAKAAVLLELFIAALIGHGRWSREPALAVAACLGALGAVLVASSSSAPGIWIGVALAGCALLLAPGRGRVRPVGLGLGAGLALLALGLGLLALAAHSPQLGEYTPRIGAGVNSWLPGAGVLIALSGLMILGATSWREQPLLLPSLAGALLLAALRVSAAAAASNGVWAPALAVLAGLALVVCALRALGARSAVGVVGWLAAGQCAWYLVALAGHYELAGAAALFVLASLLAAWTASALVLDPGEPDLARAARAAPARTALLALAAASLAGLPPLGGFFADFNVLAALFSSGMVPIAALALLGWVLALLALLRLEASLFLVGDSLESRADARWRPAPLLAVLLIVCVAVLANPIQSLAQLGASALGLR